MNMDPASHISDLTSFASICFNSKDLPLVATSGSCNIRAMIPSLYKVPQENNWGCQDQWTHWSCKTPGRHTWRPNESGSVEVFHMVFLHASSRLFLQVNTRRRV